MWTDKDIYDKGKRGTACRNAANLIQYPHYVQYEYIKPSLYQIHVSACIFHS